jgi:hypothetical protein
MQGTTATKIKAIIDQGAIEYDRERKIFLCKPIMQKNGKPYNHTTHELKSHAQFGFSCSCQAWQMRLEKHQEDPINQSAPGCSHVAALYEYLKRQHNTRRESNIGQAMLTMFSE